MTENERINSILARLFYKRAANDPEFMMSLPDDAHFIFQIKGDEDFNAWARSVARKRRGSTPMYLATFEFEKLPAHSSRFPERLSRTPVEGLELQTA